MTTAKTIDIIDSLFTEEQRSILEYELNNFKVTIKNQLNAQFGEQFPMYSNELKIKVIAANIIKSQQHLINKIENEIKYLEIWKDPENYASRMKDIKQGETRNKSMSIENIQKASESVASSKMRQGDATRSFDYIGEEQKWDKEDALALSISNIQVNFKKTDTNDVTTAKIVQAYQEQHATAFDVNEELQKQLTQEIIEPREEAYLNTITINKGRTQQRNKKIQTLDTFRDTENKKDSTNESIQSIQSVNAINSWTLEVVNVRDRFFNSFNVLFSDFPLCL